MSVAFDKNDRVYSCQLPMLRPEALYLGSVEMERERYHGFMPNFEFIQYERATRLVQA